MSVNDREEADMAEGGVLPEMADEDDEGEAGVRAMLNVPMKVDIVLGRTRHPLAGLIAMKRGAVFELDRRVGDDVDVVVGDRVVAQGQLVKVGDNGVGVKLTRIVREIGPGQA